MYNLYRHETRFTFGMFLFFLTAALLSAYTAIGIKEHGMVCSLGNDHTPAIYLMAAFAVGFLVLAGILAKETFSAIGLESECLYRQNRIITQDWAYWRNYKHWGY